MTVPFDMPGSSASFEERGGWVTRRLMADFELTVNQAAGLVGNLGFESRGFKTLQEIAPAVLGSLGGYGWAQWTGPRRRAFEAWCLTHHLGMASDEANYSYLAEELCTTHASTITQLKKTVSLDAAVWSVGQTFERPGGTTATYLPGLDDRLRYAQRALVGAQRVQPAPAATAGDRRTLTRDTIRAWQRQLGVAADGDPGERTMKALRAYLDAREPR